VVKQLSPPENDLFSKFILVILSAGEGKRFGSLSDTLPKSLIELKHWNDIPILQYTLERFHEFGIQQYYIIMGHLKEKIVQFVEDLFAKNPFFKGKITLLDSGMEYKKGPLYSFYSIFNHLTKFKEENYFMIIPGDTFFEQSLLKELKKTILMNEPLLTSFPLLFYHYCSLMNEESENFHDSETLSKKISIVGSKKQESGEYLEKIELRSVQNLRKERDAKMIKQIIPACVFNFKFMQEIITSRQEIQGTTLRDLLNFFASKKGEKILVREIKYSLPIFDIDRLSDLQEFERYYSA